MQETLGFKGITFRRPRSRLSAYTSFHLSTLCRTKESISDTIIHQNVPTSPPLEMIILFLPPFEQIHTPDRTNALSTRRSQPTTIQREQYKHLSRPGRPFSKFPANKELLQFFLFFGHGWLGGVVGSLTISRLAVQHGRFRWMLLALLLSLS